MHKRFAWDMETNRFRHLKRYLIFYLSLLRSFVADDYHFFLEKADSLFLRFSKLVSNWDCLRKFHLLFLWIKFESCQRVFRCCISHRISSIWRFICNSDYVPLFLFAEYFHFFPQVRFLSFNVYKMPSGA